MGIKATPHVLLVDLSLEPAQASRELLVKVLLHVVRDPQVGRLPLYRVLKKGLLITNGTYPPTK